MFSVDDVEALRLLVEVVMDEEQEKETVSSPTPRCTVCNRNFKSASTLAFHTKTKHDERPNIDIDVSKWWSDIKGPSELSKDANLYFTTTFQSDISNDQLWLKFAKDGVEVLPRLLCLGQIDSVEYSRRMFDKFVSLRVSQQASTDEQQEITQDDNYILQYIGGFMVQKLRKKVKSKEELEILEGMVNSGDIQSDSLIGVLNNVDYGSLTVPSSVVLKLLVYIESKFRAYAEETDILTSVFKSLNVHYIRHLFPDILENDSLNVMIAKISMYFIKIRCYQKARKWNSKLSVKFDQNVSQRKAMK